MAAQVCAGRYRQETFVTFLSLPVSPSADNLPRGGWQGRDEAQPSLPACCCGEISLLSSGGAKLPCRCRSIKTPIISLLGTLRLPSAATEDPPSNNRQGLNASPKVKQQRGNSNDSALITSGGFKGSLDGPGPAEHPPSAGSSAHLAQMWVTHTGCVSPAAASQPPEEEFQLQQHKPGCCSQSHKGKIELAQLEPKGGCDVQCLLGVWGAQRGSYPKISPKHQAKDASL